MKTIKLTQGKEVIVDDKYYNYLNQWSWHLAVKNGHYAARRKKGESTITLCKQLLEYLGYTNIRFRFKNKNSLDNRLANIKILHRAPLKRNKDIRAKHKYKNTQSEYKGVYWNKRNKKYDVEITIDRGKKKYIGSFDDPKEAAKAYNEAALIVFGKDTYLNEI